MKNFLLGTVLIGFVACTSGGNGSGTTTLTHNQLASQFVSELNLDASFDVALVKADTLQNNFLVIYDPLTNTYDAIDISDYDPAYDNASDYYYNGSIYNYFDLDFLPNHQTQYGNFEDSYLDYSSGLIFEKTAATPKDLAKMSAIKEAHVIQKTAENLSSTLGLSLNRGKEIAKLTNHWKKASKKGLTNAETDKFATELLGFSLSQGVNAYKDSLEGDNSSIEALVESAASVNNISPEHATQLMTKVFGL